ncbi:MAG: hypothetical protein IKH20_02720 [Clostridiales bacterium]|nr:hypothetical protein [Clostridiales bacterium]
MRYYGEDFKLSITDSLNKVHDSVDGSDYAQIIRNVDISSKNARLKTECVNAGGTAYSHVDSIREKLNNLVTVLSTFYDGVDDTADTVLESAKKIRELLEETNSAIVRMNASVNSIGEYSGTKVTPDALKDAGLNEEKCAGLKADIWDKLFSIQFKDGEISYDEAVAFVDYINNLQKNGLKIPGNAKKLADAVFSVYIDKMKSLDSDKISSVDMERLKTIYDYYVDNRNIDGVNSLDPQTLQNVVDVYEILDPEAKTKTTDLFADVSGKDPKIDLNILRIKYALYTADEKYRDIMFYYMDQFRVELTGPGEVSNYNKNIVNGKRTLYIALDRGYTANFCSFFHEFGHGIDDLSVPDGPNGESYASSNGTNDILVSDLKKHMQKSLEELGIDLPGDQEIEVVNYFFNSNNANVKDLPWGYGLPNEWTVSQKIAYYKLRDHYGYKEYEYVGNPGKAFDSKSKFGVVSNPNKTMYYNAKTASGSNQIGQDTYGIREDIVGGLTNHKIGGVGSAHGASGRNTLPQDTTIINSKEALSDGLSDYKYWYGDYTMDNGVDHYRSLNSSPASEFYAECWEYSVLGYDMKPTQEIFEDSCKHFNESVDKIWNDIPH